MLQISSTNEQAADEKRQAEDPVENASPGAFLDMRRKLLSQRQTDDRLFSMTLEEGRRAVRESTAHQRDFGSGMRRDIAGIE
ncbi:MAG: hypothetical protein JRG80_19640 [Deltaproteobacteria bacterium]|nr:hypothetical protein [Deltaproteobacteria bacterium]MBW2401436.1 hypothetical protein [Deltaproteobacteria bacterium]